LKNYETEHNKPAAPEPRDHAAIAWRTFIGAGSVSRGVSCIVRSLPRKILYCSISITVGISILWAMLPSRQQVSLVFVGFQTNRLLGPKEDHVVGLIRLTNATRRPIPYTQFNQMPDHACLYQMGGAWTDLQGLCCPRHKVWLGASRIEDHTLSPSQEIAFKVVLERTNTPCKVQFQYPVPTTNRLYRILPSWLVRRLPWRKNPVVVETAAFEYRE
jgi:hypothetical protein